MCRKILERPFCDIHIYQNILVTCEENFFTHTQDNKSMLYSVKEKKSISTYCMNVDKSVLKNRELFNINSETILF